MSDIVLALAVWLPLGTIVPLVLSRVTGADWRGAVIEASLFATMGLLIFPITIALISAAFVDQPNVDLIFAASYVLALGCVLAFRRHSNERKEQQR